jgi:hypothetical protein
MRGCVSRVIQLCCAQVKGFSPQPDSSGEASLWMTFEYGCAAIALKRDGRVLIFSSAGGHGDGAGAQQANGDVGDVVASVWRLRV